MAGHFDPYAELGVARTATDSEIAHAFRQRVRRHHPDTRALDDPAAAAASDLALQRAVAAVRLIRRQQSRDSGTGERTPDRSRRVDVGPPAEPVPLRVTPVQWAPAGRLTPERTRLLERLLWLVLRDPGARLPPDDRRGG